MDLHDPQFQGYFDIPVDNLHGSPLMMKYIYEHIPNYKEALIVSPDGKTESCELHTYILCLLHIYAFLFTRNNGDHVI